MSRPRTIIPAGFAAYRETHSGKQTAARFGVCRATVTKWTRLSGLGTINMTRPMPDNFRARAPSLTYRAAKDHWHTATRTVMRWYAEAGIVPADPRIAAVPADFAVVAPDHTVAELTRRYGRADKVVKRWLAETGTTARTGRAGRPATRVITAEPGAVRAAPHWTPAPDGSTEGRAADHLRRRYPSVFRCNRNGRADPKGRFWRAGLAVLSGAELLERARRHGFEPDAWMRVAA